MKIHPSLDKLSIRTQPLKQERVVEIENEESVGSRFGGNANNGNCSPRNLNANNGTANAYRNNCGFAQSWAKEIINKRVNKKLSSVFARSAEQLKDMDMKAIENIVEMSGCRQASFSPAIDITNNDIFVTRDDIMYACETAFKDHSGEKCVIDFKENLESNVTDLYNAYLDGSYKEKIHYRQLTKKNKNGKIRFIDSPDLVTRIYQHLVLNKLGPLYYAKDNGNGLNCKPGYGITAKEKSKSLIKKMKHAFYDRLDLNYYLVIDQRQCYEHVKDKIFRKMVKRFTRNKKFIDFATDVSFVEGKLPIGTPTSPLIHHIIMKEFDDLAKRLAPFSVRYADDNFLAFQTKEEANAAKWRIKNYWWYALNMRAKRQTTIINSFDTPLDFCGYVFHRNNKPITAHNKGYVKIRRRVAEDAKKCTTNESWASYFGLLKNCDSYSLMLKIQTVMKLRELTQKIKIDRSIDAENITLQNLEGKVFTIYKYDIRKNKEGEPNWIKCLIGIDELGLNGVPTGRKRAYEFHGNYQGIVDFIVECEKKYGKENILPLEDAEVENRCGYVFKDSTNVMTYID